MSIISTSSTHRRPWSCWLPLVWIQSQRNSHPRALTQCVLFVQHFLHAFKAVHVVSNSGDWINAYGDRLRCFCQPIVFLGLMFPKHATMDSITFLCMRKSQRMLVFLVDKSLQKGFILTFPCNMVMSHWLKIFISNLWSQDKSYDCIFCYIACCQQRCGDFPSLHLDPD